MLTQTDEQQAKCKACRECCEYVEYPVSMISMELMAYYLERGDRFYMEPGGALMFRVYKPCRHLTDDGCDIYDERPVVCRRYMCTASDSRTRDEKTKMEDQYMAHIGKALTEWQARPRET